jgi:hypothetical protein
MGPKGITGEWHNPAERRCNHKNPYDSQGFAEKRAKEQSEASGHHIIAYKCYDCSAWHIGHADYTQLHAGDRKPKPRRNDTAMFTAPLTRMEEDNDNESRERNSIPAGMA